MSGISTKEMQAEVERKQAIHNLTLKTACLENEEYIQELHVSDWSEVQRSKLSEAHTKAIELLTIVETDTHWSVGEVYDLPKLQKVCGLELSRHDCYCPEDKPKYMDIIAWKKILEELKLNNNKTRMVSFTDMIDKAAENVSNMELDLRRSQLDATPMTPTATLCFKQVEDMMNVTNIESAFGTSEEQIRALLGKLEHATEVQNVAFSDGEMQVAEEQMYLRVSLLEQLMDLIRAKFGITDVVASENEPFGKGEVLDKCMQELQKMKDEKRRLKQRAETDLKHVMDALQKADLEDAECMKRFTSNRAHSEVMLHDNLSKQEDCWDKIQDLERQLQKLGTERFEEIKQRITDNDAEEKRKTEYQAFLETIAEHRKVLELTVFNTELALKCFGTLEEIVRTCCEKVKERYEKTVQTLEALKLEFHKQYLEFFRMLYLALGNLIYKKQKKLDNLDSQIRTSHIQLEFCIEVFDASAKKWSEEKKALYVQRGACEEELRILREKQAQAADDFSDTEKVLFDAGIEFIHPDDEHQEEKLSRRSKMVEYRAHLSKQEELKIIAEREQIAKARQLRLSPGTPRSIGSSPGNSPGYMAGQGTPRTPRRPISSLTSPLAGSPQTLVMDVED